MITENLKYQVFDTECLKGSYFSYQWRNENMEESKMIECKTDEDCYKFYNNLKKANRAMYCYSINYDKTMLNALCKFVEKGITDIPTKLRRVNDYLIMGELNYFRINTEFWCNYYYRLEIQFDNKTELFKESIKRISLNENDKYITSFLEEFPYLLGQSKVFKNLNIIDVPKMLYYFTIRKDGVLRMNISLKKLQLYEEQTNITHDFEKSFDFEELVKDGKYKQFKKYALNDSDFLFRYFQKKCLPIIENRVKACEAIKMFDESFEPTERMIHSENNTNLLINAFSLKQKQNDKKVQYEDNTLELDELTYGEMLDELNELTEKSNGTYETEFISGELIPVGTDYFIKEFNEIIEKYEHFKKPKNKFGIDFKKALEYKDVIDMTEYIKPTGYEKFDNFVKFVDMHPYVTKDKKLKELYCESYEKEYINDDKQQEHEGQIQVIVDSFDTFNLFGTTVTIGLGGIHGAIEKYINENLWHLDYRSLYPSIIILFEKYYGKIIKMPLYKALYNFRNFEVKVQLKEIDEKINAIYTKIDEGGNDGADIMEYQGELQELEESKNRLEYLSDGCKLLLNSLYGLINSEFNFSISHKQLGRFICLYGQYRVIELCKLIMKNSPQSKLPNINTDGIIIDNIDKFICSEIAIQDKQDDIVILGINKIDKIIQNDVNNYIKITEGKTKTKGNAYRTGIKQAFHRFEKLTCNISNALKLINHEKPEVLPVLFHNTAVKSTIKLEDEETSKNKVYYLTTQDKGKIAIKWIANPIVLTWGGEYMYFTTNKDDADPQMYLKFAQITKDKIMNFTLTETDNIKYYPYELIEDTDNSNLKKKKDIRKMLNKIAKGFICINGLNADIKQIMVDDLKPVKELSNYTMTKIINSTEVKGFSLKNDEEFTCLATNNKKDIKRLDELNTFKVTHKSGHVMYVLKNAVFMDLDKYNKVNIVNADYIPVITLDGEFTCNLQEIKVYSEEGVKK
jgi:hypothetical protein